MRDGDGGEFLAPIINDNKYLETIKAHTGRIVVKPSSYMEWLSYQAQTAQKKLKLYKWVGWDDEGFRHPSLRKDGYFYIIEEERFTTFLGNAQKHWDFTKKVLASSGLFNPLFLASSSAPLLYRAGMPNYVVYISGKTGTGKTTACKLACNLFYDNRLPITLFGTVNALERTLSTIKDLPILFDEDELRKDENLFTHLIYMFHSGRGKRRAKATLEVEQSTLRGVLFLTGEHSLEQNIQNKRVKLGALRRALEIRVEDKSDWGVDFDEMIEALEHVGHVGLEWIKFLESLDDTEIMQAFEQAKREHGHKFVSGMEPIGQTLYATAILWRRFGLEVNTEALDRFFERLKGEVERKIEKRELGWWDELMAWVNASIRNFERRKDGAVSEPVPADRYMGRIEGNWLMITKSAFESFCRERDIDADAFLKFLSKKGVLRKFGRGLYERLKCPAGKVYHYYINLNKADELFGDDLHLDINLPTNGKGGIEEEVVNFKVEVERLYQDIPTKIRKEIEKRGGYRLDLDTKGGSLVVVLRFDGQEEEYRLRLGATGEEMRKMARTLIQDLVDMASGDFLEF